MSALEDSLGDIITKAQHGLRLTDDRLARQAGISILQLRRIKAGECDHEPVRRLADALQLAPEPLIAIGCQRWQPHPVELPGLACFRSPHGWLTVNAYLIWDTSSGAAAAFDAGADVAEMIQFARHHHLSIRDVFLTHAHSDHIAGLETLLRATSATAHCSELEPVAGAVSFAHGATFPLGTLTIATRPSCGHTRGGTIYVVSGLQRPVAVVGDAMFAGSLGRPLYSYQDALRTAREQILSLPAETVLCCGHGPMTTVGEEKEHNPFFAPRS